MALPEMLGSIDMYFRLRPLCFAVLGFSNFCAVRKRTLNQTVEPQCEVLRRGVEEIYNGRTGFAALLDQLKVAMVCARWTP